MSSIPIKLLATFMNDYLENEDNTFCSLNSKNYSGHAVLPSLLRLKGKYLSFSVKHCTRDIMHLTSDKTAAFDEVKRASALAAPEVFMRILSRLSERGGL